MGNAVRLVSGGTIQVRTGILAGVGPQGPRGPVGPIGLQGDQGPTGDTGAMGQILQVGTRCNISSTTSLTAVTFTLVGFGTIAYDDQAIVTSSSRFTAPSAGDYMFSVYCAFAAAGTAGARILALNSSISGTVWETGVYGTTTSTAYCALNVVQRAAAGEYFEVRAYSEQATSISVGAIQIERVGSGPVGPQGVAGPQGPAGATGPTGSQGPAGSASSGFATYADLL